MFEMQEPRVIVNVADSRAGNTKVRGRGQYANSGTKTGSGRGKSTKVCTFCEKIGHTVDATRNIVIHLISRRMKA